MGFTSSSVFSKLNSFIKKHHISLCFIIIVLASAFIYSQHSYKQIIPIEVSSYYEEFLNAYRYGTYDEVDSYLHYEVPEYWQLTEEDFSNIESYEIISWEQLADDLWVVTLNATTSADPEVARWNHFIGYIDAELYVMIGAFQVPDYLSEGTNIAAYIPEGVLSPDSVELFDIFR